MQRSPRCTNRCMCTWSHLERELWAHAGIRINLVKTQIFIRAGFLPHNCQHIIRAGLQLNPPVVVWRGDSVLSPVQRGVTILGTHLGHLYFVKAQLRAKAEEHRILLNRVEAMTDFQCAWLMLRLRRIITSARSSQRGQKNSQAHHKAISRVFNSLLDIRGDKSIFDFASLPCRLGGVGLRNAVRGVPAAYWSSWADSLHMIRKRHPDISDFITVTLGRGGGGFHTEAGARCRASLVELGFDVPEWSDLALRPDLDPAADKFPSLSRHGWQTESFRRCGE